MTAQEIADRAVGEICWRAERGHGSFLTFDFGQRVSGPYRDRGEWHLWIYFGDWTLSEPDKVLATDSDDHAVIEAAAGRFAGSRLVNVSIDDTSLEATFQFEHGLRLDVRPNSCDEDPDEDWWLLFTPDERVLVVGPGPAWSYKNSNEP